MITIFSTPKPFVGHIDIIQRNAIKSWTLLHPDVEVILFGDEEGAAKVCSEYGVRHEPNVQRNEYGTKLLGCFFDRAQEIALNNVLCYANCDIMLTSDFRQAVEQVSSIHPKFLMVGQRWDTDVTEPYDFSRPEWQEQVRAMAEAHSHQRPPIWIDYFVFTRGLYRGKIPPFVIGRPGWDPWLVWYARSSKVPVVDASRMVVAIHQNHNYSYHPAGEMGVWQGEEAQRNYRLLGEWRHYCTTKNATHVLTPKGLRTNYRHWWAFAMRGLNACKKSLWFGLLGVSRPFRHALGLRQEQLGRLSNARGRSKEGR